NGKEKDEDEAPSQPQNKKLKDSSQETSTPLKQEGNSISNTKINVKSKMTITRLSSHLPPTGHRNKKTPQKISTKSPTVNMGRKIPSTREKPLKSRLGEDTQLGETSESESEMVEGRTISSLTTITDERVTAPDATTSSEATARQIN
ncbi:hypothetical protein BpHYR1_036067, partial [Brachionus plicatilis]